MKTKSFREVCETKMSTTSIVRFQSALHEA